MRVRVNPFKQALMISALVISSAFVFSGCDKDDDDNDNMFNVSGSANGTQMVPTVAGSGTATFNGTYNGDTRVMTYTTNWNGLTGGPTAASFYGGASGTNGATIGSPWTLASGTTGSGNFSGTMTLTPAEASQLMAGNWYYTMGTTANPTGEVRGQLTSSTQ